MIRRAERESLRCETGASEAHLSMFYSLLLLTRRRHQVPPQPFAWFPEPGRVHGRSIQDLAGLKGSVPVAGMVLLRHRDTLV